MSVVSMEHIGKRFGKKVVLKDISLSLEKGEVVCIIGTSGCGKSTLLRCATLLNRFERGSLAYGDLVVAHPDKKGKAIYANNEVRKHAREKFGLVFQNFNLFPHRTVLQNVMDAPVRVQGRNEEEVEREARELLERFALEGEEDKVPCELSGGQCQRVAIARAMCMNPEVLFFDEPTSALDPKRTQDVMQVVREQSERGITVVVVTHDMDFARQVSDRVVFMDEGLIAEEGTPEQVFGSPKSERAKTFLSKHE